MDRVFRIATADICIYKSDFRNNYFLERTAISEYLKP